MWYLLVLSSHAFNRKRVYSLTFCRVSDLKTAKIRIMFKHLRLHTYLYYHSLGTRSVSSVQIWLQTSFSWRNTSTKNHLDRKRKKGSSFVPDGARPERLMVHDAARGKKKKISFEVPKIQLSRFFNCVSSLRQNMDAKLAGEQFYWSSRANCYNISCFIAKIWLAFESQFLKQNSLC